MNYKAKQYFARVAIENVFWNDPTYLCDHLFGGDWVKMYEYITGKIIPSASNYFPDPDWTEIAPGWTEYDYKTNRISMSERWEEYDMSYALRWALDEAYYAVRNALESGITLEDLKCFG